MARIIISAVSVLVGLVLPLVSAQTFEGSGTISVLSSNNFMTANPVTMTIGCIDATGTLTMDDCAVFTRLDVYPYTLSSSAGNCSFLNETSPANTDSVYGNHSYAWTCWDHESVAADELYTVRGLPYPFLCSGDADCYFDLPSPPTASSNVPVWQYLWGSQQRGITPGHTQAVFYWKAT